MQKLFYKFTKTDKENINPQTPQQNNSNDINRINVLKTKNTPEKENIFKKFITSTKSIILSNNQMEQQKNNQQFLQKPLKNQQYSNNFRQIYMQQNITKDQSNKKISKKELKFQHKVQTSKMKKQKSFTQGQQKFINNQFKAQEIPDYSKLSQLGVSKIFQKQKPTIPHDIKFQTDLRSELYKQQNQKQQKDIIRQNNFQFKARPSPNMKKQSVPKKPPARPNTTLKQVNLASDKRAEQRKNFDSAVKEKIETKDLQKQKVEEDKEIQTICNQFKAQPIRKYKQITIQKTQKSTIPVEIQFQTDKRIGKQRSKINNDN